ncbi:MAG: hypothetical protein GC147_01400 [Porphyrobacter sp.]|nr:hypothetical protein [Porphyrobacter sp.]
MSGSRDFVTLGVLAVLVAGAVWLSALFDTRPQVTEAAAAAIKAEMAFFIEVYADPAARKACTSKTVEGDFGMFSAMTYWFDETGQDAGMLEIEAVRCPTSRRCIVDINTVGSGMRYELEKTGDDWAVNKSDIRWIV